MKTFILEIQIFWIERKILQYLFLFFIFSALFSVPHFPFSNFFLSSPSLISPPPPPTSHPVQKEGLLEGQKRMKPFFSLPFLTSSDSLKNIKSEHPDYHSKKEPSRSEEKKGGVIEVSDSFSTISWYGIEWGFLHFWHPQHQNNPFPYIYIYYSWKIQRNPFWVGKETELSSYRKKNTKEGLCLTSDLKLGFHF